MATGPVSWSLTHPTVLRATVRPSYLGEKHSALFVVTGTDDSL